MEGIECMLFGRVDASLGRLRERLGRMGAVPSEGDETHLIYAPLQETEAAAVEEGPIRSRTSALLHVYDDGKAKRIIHYTPGDYGSGESSTTVMNMTEMVVEGGEVADLLALLEYQLAKATLNYTVTFGLPTTVVRAMREEAVGDAVLQDERWLVMATARCKDRAELAKCEGDLMRVATFLDEYYFRLTGE